MIRKNLRNRANRTSHKRLNKEIKENCHNYPLVLQRGEGPQQ